MHPYSHNTSIGGSVRFANYAQLQPKTIDTVMTVAYRDWDYDHGAGQLQTTSEFANAGVR